MLAVREGTEAFDLAPGHPDGGPTPDAELMRGLVAGSEEALAHLYDRYGGAVFATAMRTSRDRAIAADVVQETFVTLWNRAELFDPSRGTLPAWLARIARNRAVDHLRADGRRDQTASFSSFGLAGAEGDSTVDWLTSAGRPLGVAELDPGPERALTDKETRASIREAVASLDPLERAVIAMAYESGLTQSEIASRTGWPIGTVKTRTRRALRHLRERLEDRDTPAPAASGATPRGPDRAPADRAQTREQRIRTACLLCPATG